MRVGIGYDIRDMDASRPLVLGGLKIEGTWGLRGPSDGDVVLRSLIDALLGAAGLGDLGDHFPADEERWRDVPSAVLVAEVRTKVRAQGYLVENADVTVIAERPRLADHRGAMGQRIADLLGLDPRSANVKATSAVLGALGDGKGIAALSVVMLRPAPDEAA